MKRDVRRERGGEDDGFPRRNRRGLIEAHFLLPRTAIRTDGFPGGIAGASLKRAELGDDRVDGAHGFPGGIAGASLKLAE